MWHLILFSYDIILYDNLYRFASLTKHNKIIFMNFIFEYNGGDKNVHIYNKE